MGMNFKLGLADSLLSDCSSAEKLAAIKKFLEFSGCAVLNEVIDGDVQIFVWHQQESDDKARTRYLLNKDYFGDDSHANYILNNYRNYNGGAPYSFFPDMSDTTIFVPMSNDYAKKIALPDTPLDGLIYSGVGHLSAWAAEQREASDNMPEIIDGISQTDYWHFLEQLEKCCAAAEDLDVCLVIY